MVQYSLMANTLSSDVISGEKNGYKYPYLSISVPKQWLNQNNLRGNASIDIFYLKKKTGTTAVLFTFLDTKMLS